MDRKPEQGADGWEHGHIRGWVLTAEWEVGLGAYRDTDSGLAGEAKRRRMSSGYPESGRHVLKRSWEMGDCSP